LTITRKDFLWGVGCAAAGVAGAAAGVAGVVGTSIGDRLRRRFVHGSDSYSQSGEDLIVHYISRAVPFTERTYLDVGAHDPVDGNNTYLFYRLDYRGVLVEPNVTMCQKLRNVRPGDTVLEAGIGITAAKEADYYVMTDSSWNTFDKEEAERQVKASNGKITIEKVVKMPLLDINQVMAEHFQKAPSFLSVDVQGIELAILKTIDYARFRPNVICAETVWTGTSETKPETAAFMETQGYVVRGMTFVNTIFVDSKILSERQARLEYDDDFDVETATVEQLKAFIGKHRRRRGGPPSGPLG
jgi:FkbM family methyltransferase